MPSLDPALSRQVFERDRWKCRHCNSRDGLHPHHVIYQSHSGPDELNNLLTLCWQCHRAHHDGFLAITVVALTERNLIIRFERKRNWRPQ
jgi:5-methylcytosine-specific restriction endonuclease McrA